MDRGIQRPCLAKSPAFGATRSSAERENAERTRRSDQGGAHRGRGGPGSAGFHPAAAASSPARVQATTAYQQLPSIEKMLPGFIASPRISWR
jgi:hypothetical protein